MILSAGLSPAWQEILVLDRLRLGEVNRARQCHWSASGKVLNAARTIHRLSTGPGGSGGPSRTLTMFGGPAGEAMAGALSREGMDLRWIESATPSRVCTTVIDTSSDTITELVENAGSVTADELEQFRSAFAREIEDTTVVVLMGSLPGGAPSDYYHSLLRGVEKTVILDARGPELLAVLPLKPFLVKPNREELSRTLKRPIEGEEELRHAMAEVSERGAQWVVVTQGSDAVWAHQAGKFYRFHPPRVQAQNTIGCGDCMAGGIAHAISLGRDPLEAIRQGIACGVENAAVLFPADLHPEKVQARMAEVIVEEKMN